MSNSTNQSDTELVEELKKARKNFGYPVIVAIDKKTTNHVLKQEFIERYSGDVFIDPMNSEVDITPGMTYHQLLDFCLDEPRLSFENADLSGSKATLLMRTVRGKQIQLSQAIGSTRRRVTRLAEATPVNGPALVFDIELSSVTGEVSNKGRAYFSFAEGENYAFYGGVTQFEIDKLGDHFKEYFNGYDETPGDRAIIEYTLGQIADLPDSALKPTEFVIRTHGKKECKLKESQSFGDGAVILFIKLDNFNSDDAIPPDNNNMLPYLLPDGYSANCLINWQALAELLIIPAIRNIDEEFEELIWEKRGNKAESIKYFANGVIRTPYTQDYVNGWIISFPPIGFNVDYYGSLSIASDNGTLAVDWTGTIDYTAVINKLPETNSGKCISTWNIHHEYYLSVDDGRLSVKSKSQKSHFNTSVAENLQKILDRDAAIKKRFNELWHEFLDEHTAKLNEVLLNFSPEINVFIFSSLLFRNSQITLDSAHLPNDALAIGQLARDRNKFTIARSDNAPIDNGETSVLPGGNTPFKTDPATAGVTWSVRHLSDYEGDNSPGKINPTTGVYTAPAADAFKGTHVKVIVTATKGTEVSHVLVSVLRTNINVYPSIDTVNLKSYTDIIAGEMNGEKITWKIEGLGNFKARPNNDPLAQANTRYFAPHPDDVPIWQEGMPVVDKVMRHSKVVVSSGNNQKVVDILLPLDSEGTIWLEAEAAGAGVKFKCMIKNKDTGQPEEVEKESTTWHVRIGNGKIIDGVYTPDPAKPEEYAVIVAIYDIPLIRMYASMILPLPFIDVKQFLALHAPDEAKAISSQ